MHKKNFNQCPPKPCGCEHKDPCACHHHDCGCPDQKPACGGPNNVFPVNCHVIDNMCELKKLLAEVFIRFDTDPSAYQKDDFRVLLKVIAQSLDTIDSKLATKADKSEALLDRNTNDKTIIFEGEKTLSIKSTDQDSTESLEIGEGNIILTVDRPEGKSSVRMNDAGMHMSYGSGLIELDGSVQISSGSNNGISVGEGVEIKSGETKLVVDNDGLHYNNDKVATEEFVEEESKKINDKIQEIINGQWFGTRSEYEELLRNGQINDKTVYFVYESDSPEKDYSLSEDGKTLTLNNVELSADGKTLTIPSYIAVLSDDGKTLIFK